MLPIQLRFVAVLHAGILGQYSNTIQNTGGHHSRQGIVARVGHPACHTAQMPTLSMDRGFPAFFVTVSTERCLSYERPCARVGVCSVGVRVRVRVRVCSVVVRVFSVVLRASLFCRTTTTTTTTWVFSCCCYLLPVGVGVGLQCGSAVWVVGLQCASAVCVCSVRVRLPGTAQP